LKEHYYPSLNDIVNGIQNHGVSNMRLLMFAAVLLSLATPAIADEGASPSNTAGVMVSQPSEPQVLERVYSESLDEVEPGEVKYDEWLDQRLAENNRIQVTPRELGAIAVTALMVPPGLVAGWLVGFSACPDVGADAFMCLVHPTTVVGAVGGTIIGLYLGHLLGNRIRSGGAEQSDLPVSIAPYRHDDASGLMFSGQF
jgi:hypothetical protein